MSGRTRVTLKDGRRVTGFRKTLKRRAPVTPPHLMPDWRMTFSVPGALALKVVAGMVTDLIGVAVLPGPTVEVRGKDREFVLTQASKFLASIASGHADLSVVAMMSRADEPPPTLGAPPRRGYSGIYDLIYTAGAAVVMIRPYDKPMIFPAGR